MKTELANLYTRYLKSAGDPKAAATLVLAHLASQAPTDNLSVKQAAKQLGVSAKTVYALCDSGQLRHSRLGRVIRIQPHDLQAYMDSAPHQAAGSYPLLGI